MLPSSGGSRRALDLARVLLVHGDLAPRLALQTILQAGGYSVDVAASPAEALSKLDEGRYALVLSDTNVPLNVLAYARVKKLPTETEIFAARDRKLTEARERRKEQREAARLRTVA